MIDTNLQNLIQRTKTQFLFDSLIEKNIIPHNTVLEINDNSGFTHFSVAEQTVKITINIKEMVDALELLKDSNVWEIKHLDNFTESELALLHEVGHIKHFLEVGDIEEFLDLIDEDEEEYFDTMGFSEMSKIEKMLLYRATPMEMIADAHAFGMASEILKGNLESEVDEN